MKITGGQDTCPVLPFYVSSQPDLSSIKTTGLAGGMGYPYKGSITS